MTTSELTELKKLIVNVATFYARSMTPEVVVMMVEDLQDLPLAEIKTAYEKYRREDKHMRYPMPAVIRAMVQPEVDPENLAQEAAARVVQAISRFGYTNGPEARLFIGELGWRCVERFGGWRYLCENVGVEINQQTIFAQMRDLSRATIKLDASGHGDKPIGLPSQQHHQIDQPVRGLEMAKDILKSILPVKDLK